MRSVTFPGAIAYKAEIGAGGRGSDVLDDTFADLTSTPASPTFAQMIRLVFDRLWQKVTQSASQQIVYNTDDSTVIGTMPCSDTGSVQAKGRAV